MLISLSTKLPANKQLTAEVGRALKEVTESVQQMESQKSNPSVSTSYYKAVGRQDALQEVLDYVSGRRSKLLL